MIRLGVMFRAHHWPSGQGATHKGHVTVGQAEHPSLSVGPDAPILFSGFLRFEAMGRPYARS